jgi:hypothetical protein
MAKRKKIMMEGKRHEKEYKQGMTRAEQGKIHEYTIHPKSGEEEKKVISRTKKPFQR